MIPVLFSRLGYEKIVHSGRIVDYQVQVAFYPDVGFGFYISSNGPSQYSPPALTLMAMYISDLLLEEELWLTTQTACSFPEPWFPRRNQTKREKEPFQVIHHRAFLKTTSVCTTTLVSET